MKRLLALVAALSILGSLAAIAPPPTKAIIGICASGANRSGHIYKHKSEAPIWNAGGFSQVTGDAYIPSGLAPCIGGGGLGTAGSYVLVANVESNTGLNQIGYGQQGTIGGLDYFYTPHGDGYPVAWPGTLTPAGNAAHEVRFTVRSAQSICPCTAVFTIYDMTAGRSESYSGDFGKWSTDNYGAWWGVEVTDTASVLGRTPVYGSKLWIHAMSYQWFNGNGVTGWRNGLKPADILWTGGKKSCEYANDQITSNPNTPNDTVDFWNQGC